MIFKPIESSCDKQKFDDRCCECSELDRCFAHQKELPKYEGLLGGPKPDMLICDDLYS